MMKGDEGPGCYSLPLFHDLHTVLVIQQVALVALQLCCVYVTGSSSLWPWQLFAEATLQSGT